MIKGLSGYQALFGTITEKELEAIRGKYAEFEKKVTEYQKRPIEPTTTDNKKED